MTIDILARLLIARGLTTCRSSATQIALAALLAGAATQAVAAPYSPRGLGVPQTAARAESVDESAPTPRAAQRGKSPEIAWREREVCAQRGLEPVSPAFRACVARMDDNPQS